MIRPSFLDRPKNAACTWSTAPGFWRVETGYYAKVCPYGLAISVTDDYPYASLGWMLTGGFLGSDCFASGVSDCTYTSAYFSKSLPSLIFDCWKALADGLWTSSTYLEVWTRSGSTATAYAVGVPWGGSSPPPASGPSSVVSRYGCSSKATCDLKLATVTIYDDGTFTVS